MQAVVVVAKKAPPTLKQQGFSQSTINGIMSRALKHGVKVKVGVKKKK